MRTTWLASLLVTLMACDGGDPGDTAEADSDSDSGVTGDSGATDTEAPPPCTEGELTLSGSIDADAGRIRPEGDVSIGAWPFRFESGSAPFSVAPFRTVSTGDLEAGAPFVLCLPEAAPPEHLQPIGDPDSPGLATYLLGAYGDHNANEIPGGDDTLVSVRVDLLAYLDGEIPEAGLTSGWHWMVMDYETNDVAGFERLDPEAELVLDGNLLPVGRDTLDGSITPATSNTQTSVGLIEAKTLVLAFQGAADPDLATVTVDGSAPGATFSFSGVFQEAPPVEHLIPPDVDDIGYDVAAYYALAYGDANTDGGFDLNDDTLYAASHYTGGTAAEPKVLTWLRPHTFVAGLVMAVQDRQAGWHLSNGEEAGGVFETLPWGEGIQLAEPPESPPSPI